MKYAKHLFAAALALAMLLAGCGAPAGNSAGSGAPAMGRFTETLLELPGGAAPERPVLCGGQGDHLTLLDLGEEPRRWDSADGGDTWAEVPLDRGLPEEPFSADLAADGTLWVSTRTGELYRILADGTAAQVTIDALAQELGDNELINARLVAISADRVYLDYTVYLLDGNGGVTSGGDGGGLYNASGALVADLGKNFYARLGQDGLYLYTYTDQLLRLDPDTGETLASMDAGDLLGADGVEAMAVGGGQVYALSNTGVAQAAFGGELTQVIVEGADFAFGDPTCALLDLQVLAPQRLVVLLRDGVGTKLYRYDYDATLPAQPAATLRVWSLAEHDILRLAISQFRRENPDTAVELEVALNEGTSQTAQDAIRALNTQMAAGDSPDVIVLDGLPAQSLARGGLLADLSGTVPPDTLWPAFSRPFESGGKVYMLPAQWRVPVLAGPQSLMDRAGSLQSLVELLVQYPAQKDSEDPFGALPEAERPLLYFDLLRGAFDTLWASSAPEVLKDGSQLDEAAFLQFLQALQKIDRHAQLSALGEESHAGLMGGSMGNINFYVTADMFSYNMQRTQMGSTLADSIFGFTYVSGTPGTVIGLFPGLAQGAYLPQVLVGISSASAHPQQAGAFVACLLGDQVQGTPLPSGLPTNRTGLAGQMQALQALMQDGGVGVDLYDPAPLVQALTTPVLVPQVVTEAAYSAAKALCAGTLDEAGAVQQFTQAVQLYLAEQG